MNKQKIFLGADHGGYLLKNAIMDYLMNNFQEFEIINCGTDNNESVDYPLYAKIVSKKVLNTKNSLGILICGTGIGICMTANKFEGIRAALVYNEFTAEMAKAHNNANILCLGGRTTDTKLAKKLVKIWLKTQYEGGRHQKRIEQISSS